MSKTYLECHAVGTWLLELPYELFPERYSKMDPFPFGQTRTALLAMGTINP